MTEETFEAARKIIKEMGQCYHDMRELEVAAFAEVQEIQLCKGFPILLSREECEHISSYILERKKSRLEHLKKQFAEL